MQVRSGDTLIGQIRVEPVLGQWKRKAELKVLERRQRDRDGEKMEQEDKPDPRGLKEPQVAVDIIERQ